MSNHISSVQSMISYGYSETAEGVYHTRNPTLLSFNRQVMSDSFETQRTVACQAPLSMGFSRQQYWSGLPFPSPGDLPDPGSKPCLLHWQEYSLPLSHFEVAKFTTELIKNKESCVAMPKNWTKMHVLGSWNEPFLLQIWQPKKLYLKHSGILIIVHMLGIS